MTITYRQAQLGDEQAIADLHNDIIRNYYAEDYPEEARDAWSSHTPERWLEMIQGEQSDFLVALDGDLIIGCAGLNIANERLGVYVSPPYHRRGIAKRLIEEQVEKARQLRLKNLNLSAPKRAVDFYKAVGFTYLGPERHEFKNKSAITVHNMKLDLI